MNPLKQLSIAFLLALSIAFAPKVAEGQVAEKILVFAKAVEAASEALVSLTDTIEHIVLTVKKIPDSVTASREKARLIDFRARLTTLEAQKVLLSALMREYVESPAPDKWTELKQKLPEVLTRLGSLLEDLKGERSDFVLEESFKTIQQSLEAKRNPILRRLQDLPPPQSDEALNALSELRKKLDQEIRNIGRANDALASYVKARFE